jgi:hypothetical protein
MLASARIARQDFCPIDPNTTEGEGNDRDLKACQAIPPILEEVVVGLLWRRSLELLPLTPRGTVEATRPARLSPNHWICCQHTPEWRGGCRGHMASKATTHAPPPAHHLHLRRLHHSRTCWSLLCSTTCAASHRTTAESPCRYHCTCLEAPFPPCTTRREGGGGAAEATWPPRLPTRPPKLHLSHRLHQLADTKCNRH